MKPVHRTDVLVVGGGPVGLAAAIELGRRGVGCIVLEKNEGVLPLPKLTHVNARSMEQCRRWGIADRVRNAGWPPDHALDAAYVTSLAGYELTRFEIPSQRDRVLPDYTPEGSQQCPQIWFDPILAEYAASLPSVEVRFGHSFDSFEEWEAYETPPPEATRDAGILARVRAGATAEPYSIEARFLIAADGAESPIRNSLGIQSDQTGPSAEQVAITLRTRHFFDFHDKRPAATFFVLDARGGVRGVVSATDGTEHWRFNWHLRGESFDHFDANAAIRRLAGADFEYEILAVMPWTARLTLARQYRKGEVFFAGDAARTLSPTGGLGMNTGIGDAVDLGWKLAATLAGWGGPLLLESYTAERRATGARINAESLRNFIRLETFPAFPQLADDGQEGAKARKQAARFIEIEGGFRLEFENEGAGLGCRYEASPIVIPDRSEPPPYDPNDYVQTSWPGARAPHAWLADGRSTLDLFGDGFTLLRFGDDAQRGGDILTAARARGVPLTEIRIDVPEIAELYECALVLVRPDGHVAWRSDKAPRSAAALIDRVRGAA